MYGDIVRFGPYGPYGPAAQMNIGAAREKQKDYPLAVQAYEVAADRYSAQPEVASTALYKAALAWTNRRAKPITTKAPPARPFPRSTILSRFIPMTRGSRRRKRSSPPSNWSRRAGDFSTAQYYEKNKHWAAAQIYYNEVRLRSPPTRPLAEQARQRIAAIKARQPGN